MHILSKSNTIAGKIHVKLSEVRKEKLLAFRDKAQLSNWFGEV